MSIYDAGKAARILVSAEYADEYDITTEAVAEEIGPLFRGSVVVVDIEGALLEAYAAGVRREVADLAERLGAAESRAMRACGLCGLVAYQRDMTHVTSRVHGQWTCVACPSLEAVSELGASSTLMVWTVQFSERNPAEVDSIWVTKLAATRRMQELNELDVSGMPPWIIKMMEVQRG